MKTQSESPSRSIQPMDPQLRDIQPGGGVVIYLEQAWGVLRRRWLKTCRPSYVHCMETLRKGDFNPCPYEVLDPRDLKFCQNQGGWYWQPEDDPFQWRDSVPFARVGLAELVVIGGGFVLTGAALFYRALLTSGTGQIIAGSLSVVAFVIAGLVIWFFRDPPRSIPSAAGLVVSPADGKIVEIEEVGHDEYVDGLAVKIGIFLSIFSVHINRAPVSGRVIGLKYKPGKYLNALRLESARENEQPAVMMESDDGHHRGIVVRQITGAIARRIVCCLKPDDEVKRGEQFGMIKLGSRTELVLPREDGLTIRVRNGDMVRGGTSILAMFSS